MAFCELCKSEGQKTGSCAYCGTLYYTVGVTFIFGQAEKDAYGSEIRLTDKYLIVRSVSVGESLGSVTAGAAFGLVGVLAASAVDAARKKNYGFYDLRDLKKVIYPYHTNAIKKDTAFKFVNKDGTDFVLNFNMNGMFCSKTAKTFEELLRKVGVCVEDGTGKHFAVCCVKPFVNKDTFSVRVCQSAAAFVQLTKKQFVAPPMGEPEKADSLQNACSQPVQQVPPAQPIYHQPVRPGTQPVQQPVQPVYQARPMQPVQQPVQPVYQAPPMQPVQQPVQPVYQAPPMQPVRQPVQPVYEDWEDDEGTVSIADTFARKPVSGRPVAEPPKTETQTKSGACPSCGLVNPAGSRFCGRCGTRLQA